MQHTDLKVYDDLNPKYSNKDGFGYAFILLTSLLYGQYCKLSDRNLPPVAKFIFKKLLSNFKIYVKLKITVTAKKFKSGNTLLWNYCYN